MNADPRGSPKALQRTICAAILIATIIFFTQGFPGVLLLNLAVLPVAIFLILFRNGHEKDVSIPLYTEMFISGGIISIILASVLEAIAQFRTLPIWRCEQSTVFTWQCDVVFVIVVTIAVGLSEEFSKFAPLSRVKRNVRYLPQSRWFRVADTPIGMCLCAIASASGFACMENIKYVLKAGNTDFWYGVDTAALRSVLAIPFHMACTGYAAALYAREGYIIPTHAEEPHTLPKCDIFTCLFKPITSRWRSQPENANVYHYITNEEDIITSTPIEQPMGQPVLVHEAKSMMEFISILTVPAIAHGLYDSGLFLTSQFFTAAGRAADRSKAISRGVYNFAASGSLLVSTFQPMADRLTARNQSPDGFLPHSPPSINPVEALKQAENESGRFQLLGLIATCISFSAWAFMMFVFVCEWRHLIKFQRAAIPMLSRNFDTS